MQAVRTKLLVAGMSLVLPGISLAASIDFESDAEGVYASLALPDATLTLDGGSFYIVDPLSNGTHSLASFDPEIVPYVPSTAKFKVAFDGVGAASFGIRFWDVGWDDDTGHLAAFDADGNQLGETTYTNDEGGALSLTGLGPISYVLFWTDGELAGSVYWDDIRYELAEVPLPGTLGLLGIGLAGLGLVRRRAGG